MPSKEKARIDIPQESMFRIDIWQGIRNLQKRRSGSTFHTTLIDILKKRWDRHFEATSTFPGRNEIDLSKNSTPLEKDQQSSTSSEKGEIDIFRQHRHFQGEMRSTCQKSDTFRKGSIVIDIFRKVKKNMVLTKRKFRLH